MARIKLLLTRIQKLLSAKEGTLASVVARGVSGTFVLKIWYTLWMFGISLLLARMLGTNGFGIYSIAISWSALIAVFAKLGQDQTVCRYVASYKEKEDFAGMRGLIYFSIFLVSVVGLMLAAGATLILEVFFTHLGSETRQALLLAFWLVPLQALLTAIGSVSVGLSKVIRAQMPNLLVSPLVFLVLLTLTTNFYQEAISAAEVIALTIAAQAFALGVLIISTRSILPSAIYRVPAKFRIKEWLITAMSVTLMGGTYVINMNADIVMLGALAGSEAAGIYKVVTRGADLVIFSMMVISPALSPIVSQLHTSGQRIRLQRGITKVARIGLLLSLPVALFLILFGDWLLSLFGPGYIEGRMALGILSVGRVISVAAGSVAVILVMTGNERIAALGVAVSMVVNISMNAILIPVWGIEGAAIATAISTVLWSVLLVRYVWKLLGIDPTPFGFLVREERP